MSESESLVEKVARAIFDAQNGLDGDPIGAMIHEDYRVEPRDGDLGIGDTMIVCRAAARAAIRAMRDTAPVILDHEGFPAHQLVGAPEDVWRAFIDAALA